MNLTCEQYTDTIKYMKNKFENKPQDFNENLEKNAMLVIEYIETKVLKEGKFEMYYQPKYNNDNITKSAESLFRLENEGELAKNNKTRYVDPELVFAYLKSKNKEYTVVMSQIRKICNDIEQNKILVAPNGDPDFKVSFNVPLSCIDKNFVDYLLSEIKNHKMKPKNFQIEILENENFNEMPKYIPLIKTLKKAGITFALDDYGSKNATETVLDTYKYDSVKIDKKYLDDAKETNKFDGVKKKYLEIKKHLPKAQVVIEGVDGVGNDEKTRKESLKIILKELRAIGDMEYQGWGFSKAIPIKELTQILRTQNNNSPSGFGG